MGRHRLEELDLSTGKRARMYRLLYGHGPGHRRFSRHRTGRLFPHLRCGGVPEKRDGLILFWLWLSLWL